MSEHKNDVKAFLYDYKEVFVVILIFIVFFSISVYLDLFEFFYDQLHNFEKWEFDEFLGVSSVLFFGLLIFLLIRSSKLKKEVKARKKAEDGLKSALEKIELTFKYLPVAFYTSKAYGDYGATYISNNIKELTGYSPEDFISSSSFWADNIHPDHKANVFANVSVILNEEYHEYEYLWRCSDGRYKWFYDCGKLIHTDDDQGDFIIGMWLDITKHKDIEERLSKSQKLESLGLLAGGIAHDFNNLLTTIMGNLSVAKNNPNIDNELLELFGESEQAVQRASDLVSRLLTFSKGGAPVKKPLTNLGELIRSVTNYIVSGSEVSCEFNLEQNLWPFLADQGQITQVIQNLVLNAVQSIPERGQIKISVGNHIVSTSGDLKPTHGKYIRLSIEDNGTGIEESEIQKVFDPYYTTKQGGHGLGLSSVYSIIKNHGGYIDVESLAGVGTKFHIYIPADETTVEQRLEPKMQIPDDRGRILIMDDDNLIKAATGRMLTKLGYDIEYASDGEEAVKKYKESLAGRRFDLVIMDLTVPCGMGGRDATKILRTLDPEVKVIVSSGYSDDPVMSEYEKHGFIEVVKKPYRIESLSRTIDNVLYGNTH